MVHVLHIVQSLNPGGAETLLHAVTAQCKQHYPDCTNTVVSLSKLGKIGERMQQSGIVPECWNLKDPKDIDVTRPEDREPYIQKLREYLEQHPEVDVVMSWLQKSNTLCSMAVAQHNSQQPYKKGGGKPLPLIWNIHDSHPDDFLKGEERNLATGLARTKIPTLICCCGDTSTTEYKKIFGDTEKIKTTYNGIDSDRFQPNEEYRRAFREANGIAADDPVIMFSSRYSKVKDIPTFLEASKIVTRTHPNAKFVMCGGGINIGNFKKYLKIPEADLPKNVRLMGLRDDMEKVYPAADVICNTSKTEAMSLSLIEGMSCGAIPVATQAGDSPQIVGNTGRVCTIGDPQSVADGILYAIEHKEAFAGKPRQRVLDHYTIPKMAQHYIDLYSEAVSLSRGQGIT